MKRSSYSRAAVVERARAIYRDTRCTWGEALAAAYREAAARVSESTERRSAA